MIDISIIIVCHKGWERLIKCLEALNIFIGKSLSTEVIVVDNRSGEDTILTIERQFPKFRFIYNKVNGGFSNGCNLGARYATGEFFLFLNPDTVVSESELEKLLNTARQNKNFTILSCRQVNEGGKECIASGQFPSLNNLTGFQRSISRSIKRDETGSGLEFAYPDWISGSIVMIRKEMFKTLDGFDEDFWMYYEDVDLCRRVRNTGGNVVLCRNITIEHNHGGSSRINLKTTSLTKTEVHISRHIYINKNNEGSERFLIQSFLVINNLISGAMVALLGLLLFFIPKLFARTLIFLRLINYYRIALFRQSWISPRSINFNKNKHI
jgi:hypothetical protein